MTKMCIQFEFWEWSALEHSQISNSIMPHILIKNGQALIMASNSQNSLLKTYVWA